MGHVGVFAVREGHEVQCTEMAGNVGVCTVREGHVGVCIVREGHVGVYMEKGRQYRSGQLGMAMSESEQKRGTM